MHTAKPFPPIAFGLLLAVLVIPPPGSVARADLIEDQDLNYEIETPPGWVRLPRQDSWGDYGIVVGAVRELEKLKDDSTPAKGEGGWLHLAISDLPEGKTLQDMGKDEEVRRFLMRRFDEQASKWPDVSMVCDKYDSGMEVCILTAEGKAPNLQGKEAPVRAVMILSTAKKKLFQLRLYAWHTEFDAEGLKGDLDMIEMGFDIPDLRAAPEKEEPGQRPPAEGEPEDAPEGDEGEEKVFEDKLVGWKIVKPVGIKSSETYDKEKFGDVVVWFEDNDHVGSYQFIFYVIKRGRQNPVTGLAIPDTQLRTWGLEGWWPSFHRDHPNGPVRNWAWPRKSKTFLTLPDWEKERIVFAEPKKRPPKPGKIGASDLIKKLKVAEKAKGDKLGKEKVIEGYRGVMGGNRERSGREIVVRYVWGTPRLTCFISISLSRDAPMKWSEGIQKMLESIEMTGRHRRR